MISFERIVKHGFSNVDGLQVDVSQVAYVCEDLGEYVRGWKDDSQIECYLIKDDQQAIGFFALDFNHKRHTYVSCLDSFCVLRCFFIDRRFQGCGFATQALEMLSPFLEEIYSDLIQIALTVNFQNKRALYLYSKIGFIASAKSYLGGAAGPQHIMTKSVSTKL